MICGEQSAKVVVWKNASWNPLSTSKANTSHTTIASELAKVAFQSGVRSQFLNISKIGVKLFLQSESSEGVIIDIDCNGSGDILSEASRKRYFDSRRTWIIVRNNQESIFNETKVMNALQRINILPDSNVMWAAHDALVDLYKTKVNEDLIFTYIYLHDSDEKGADTRFINKHLPSTASRRKNLFNVTLTATTIISQPQYFTNWNDFSTKHIDTWPKVTFPIMKNLAQDLNYRVNMKQTDKYGVLYPNGSFDGLCGQLQRGEIEFGITSMFMRKDRWDVLDFCAETIVLKSSFMFRQPPQSAVSNIFLLPFDIMVWLVSGVTFLLVGLVLSTLSLKMKGWETTLECLSISEVFSLTIGSICQQGTHVNPRLSSVKVVIFFSFVTSMFIFTSYAAKIVAILQSPSTSIKTLSDLAHSSMTLGVQETTYKKVYFTESNDSDTQYLYKHKLEPQGEKAYMSVIDGVGRVKNSLFAFQVETSSGYDIISQTYTEREKCGLAEIVAFQLPMVAIPMKKNSGFRELFTSRLKWQREVGLFDRSKKMWIAQKPKCNAGLTDFESVGLIECLPAFKILILGYVVAPSILIMEYFYFQYFDRTVFVQNGNVEEACRVINRIMGKEGLLQQYRLTRYYEKPFQTRRRVNHEKCKAIYNEDMNRKIEFVLRKNRVDPFPGCQ